MKYTLLNTLLMTVTAATLMVGCASLSTNSTEQQAITSAAAIGTAYDLSVRPTDLPYFVAAEDELYTIAAATNIVTVTDIDTALAQAGQTNKLEALGLVTAVNLANAYITSNEGTNTLAGQEACGWVADGIDEATTTNLLELKAAYNSKFNK